MQYTLLLMAGKTDKNIDFAQNKDRGHTVEPTHTVLTSTHNLCLRVKIRKILPQFYYLKVGCKGSTLHGHIRIMYIVKRIRSKRNISKRNKRRNLPVHMVHLTPDANDQHSSESDSLRTPIEQCNVSTTIVFHELRDKHYDKTYMQYTLLLMATKMTMTR